VLKKKTKIVDKIINNVACPFCGLLCDDLVIQNKKETLKILKNYCPKAISGFEKKVPESFPKIAGKKSTLEDAIDKVFLVLKKSNSPLIAGLGTDVNGMRAVMHLADKTGAVLDHMHGNALTRNTLVLQDLGWIMTTMSEIKNRADLIIFAGTDAAKYQRFYERVIWNKQSMFARQKNKLELVYIGEKLNTKLGISPTGKKPNILNCKTEEIGEIISSLHAIITGAKIDVANVAGIKTKKLEVLAEQMKSAKYGVIIWSPADLDIPHAELTIQSFCEVVKYLTRITRFAGFSLGGDDGSTTSNNVCAWQSGYPLRVNFNKGYPDYSPHHYSTYNVLKNKEVDVLMWISSFSAAIKPPRASIPSIVLANPDIKLNFNPDVFIPIATPGVDHSGQLFRTDSVVSLPLKKIRKSSYPNVDYVLNEVLKKY